MMNQFPPAPRCPEHGIHMRFHSGSYPDRFYRCPHCGDWRENGLIRGQVSLVRAFTNGSQAVSRVEPQPIFPRIAEPYERPHVSPVVGALAVVGGIVVAGIVLSALFGDD